MRCAGIAVVALSLMACGGSGTGDDGRGALLLTGDPQRGAQIFATVCAPCHGADGSGTTQGVDLTEHVPGHTDEELVGFLAHGEGRMPDPGLPDDQAIADVLAYLRATFR